MLRLLKANPVLGLANSYLVDSAQPSSLSYLWNLGSLLAACLVVQIVTGVLLAMHYTPSAELAFASVEHIMLGTILLVAMILTAFLGYCLVYGQMSLWGATVITSMMSALPWVGGDLVELIW
ncbi:cytochrome b, partial [Phaffia rhodozyma]